jgi:hypothetical protein
MAHRTDCSGVKEVAVQTAASLSLAAVASVPPQLTAVQPQAIPQTPETGVVSGTVQPIDYRFLRFNLSYSPQAGQLFVRLRDPISGQVLQQIPTAAERPDPRLTNSLNDTELADFEPAPLRGARPDAVRTIEAAPTPSAAPPAPAPVSVPTEPRGAAIDTSA